MIRENEITKIVNDMKRNILEIIETQNIKEKSKEKLFKFEKPIKN